jgi:FkbM family methyltransferase
MGINIEPTLGQIGLFKKRRPRDINLACAVAKTEGRIHLITFDDAASNSAKNQIIDRHIRTWQLRTTGEIVVKAYPLAEILKTYVPPGKDLTFLSVDVEGMELEVLEPMTGIVFVLVLLRSNGLHLYQSNRRSQATCMAFLSNKNTNAHLFHLAIANGARFCGFH